MSIDVSSKVRLDEAGDGSTVLVMHGGGGPVTVQGLATALAADHHTVTPTHPGWNGTDRLPEVTDVPSLATLYLDLLEQRDLTDVSVVGSSIGGWLTAEMAVQDAARDGRIARIVLIDAGGIEVPGQPIRDFYGLDARGIAEYSFYDSDTFYRDPASMSAEQIATQRANLATMSELTSGGVMFDQTLQERLSSITAATLVLWGDSDGIFTPGYGKAYAAAVPGADFMIIEHAGHLPQLERPDLTVPVIQEFLRR